jgi:tetratricopeptide (TPR) repeat protein
MHLVESQALLFSHEAEKAREAISRAVHILEGFLALPEKMREYVYGLFDLCCQVATVLYRLGAHSEAIDMANKAREILTINGETSASTTNGAHVAICLLLGQIHSRIKHYDQAIMEYKKAVCICTELLQCAPNDPVFLSYCNEGYLYLGSILTLVNKRAEAKQAFASAVELLCKLETVQGKDGLLGISFMRLAFHGAGIADDRHFRHCSIELCKAMAERPEGTHRRFETSYYLTFFRLDQLAKDNYLVRTVGGLAGSLLLGTIRWVMRRHANRQVRLLSRFSEWPRLLRERGNEDMADFLDGLKKMIKR